MPSYTETFTDGAVDLGDGAAFAANALTLIADQTQHISTGLDVSANAIDGVHFIGGSPRVVGTGGEAAKFNIDATFTDEPNFVWHCVGGYIRVDFVTGTPPLVVLAGGGTVDLFNGAATRVICAGPTVNISATFDIVTELVVTAGSVTISDKSGDSIPTIRVGGNARVYSERLLATKHLSGSGVLREFNAGAATAMNMNGGTWIPMAGAQPTVTRQGGVIDLSQAKRAFTIGGTAITNYGPDRFPLSTALVTVGGGTTVDYATYAGTAYAMPGGASIGK